MILQETFLSAPKRLDAKEKKSRYKRIAILTARKRNTMKRKREKPATR